MDFLTYLNKITRTFLLYKFSVHKYDSNLYSWRNWYIFFSFSNAIKNYWISLLLTVFVFTSVFICNGILFYSDNFKNTIEVMCLNSPRDKKRAIHVTYHLIIKLGWIVGLIDYSRVLELCGDISQWGSLANICFRKRNRFRKIPLGNVTGWNQFELFLTSFEKDL